MTALRTVGCRAGPTSATRGNAVSLTWSANLSGDKGLNGTLSAWVNSSATQDLSTVLQDLTAQREALAALGVPDERIYLDKGLTGTNRARPGLDQALAAVPSATPSWSPDYDGSPARSLTPGQIGDSLVARGVKLSLGGTLYDPDDPMGKMFFNILATFCRRVRGRPPSGCGPARAWPWPGPGQAQGQAA